MHAPQHLLILATALAAACGQTGPADVPRLHPLTTIDTRGADGPPDAAPGTCWGRDETPAVLETATEAAAPQTITRQRIGEPRREIWFETPCPQDLTPDTLASLQRALAARGLYDGAVTGDLDSSTRMAIRRFQRPYGLDSDVLSLEAARRLGLAAVAP
ncbi:Putative peptidoglycan binding domain-containing protein [Tropicimonas isoalkanivorans]|uniref:Putative peptidoglycan binding domain-containing protein n=2 Tax=Tropicimonas isoalkanivorans TaxID=441112 RepID=A0A1I1JID4_9RHOB|nr:Putative peptidoglycan binding domain-containing protein [Tropicimonas isoalkanivorans]